MQLRPAMEVMVIQMVPCQLYTQLKKKKKINDIWTQAKIALICSYACLFFKSWKWGHLL